MAGFLVMAATFSTLCAALGVLPWVPRVPGQEASAVILRPPAAVGRADQGRSGQRRLVDPSPNKAALPLGVAPAQPALTDRRHSQQQALAQHPLGDLLVQGRQPDQTVRQAQPASAPASRPAIAPLRFSCVVTNILPSLGIIADCDPQDAALKLLFANIVRASLAHVGQVPKPAVDWFHWPWQGPIELENTPANARSAVQGLLHGRAQPSAPGATVWFVLSEQLPGLLLDTSAALAKGLPLTDPSLPFALIPIEPLSVLSEHAQLKKAFWHLLRQELGIRGQGDVRHH